MHVTVDMLQLISLRIFGSNYGLRIFVFYKSFTVNSPTDKLAHTEDDNYFMIL